ncbi:hypothetical protein ACIGXA_35840 [Streptomyces fildesensis]|uniref:Excreted virulence factor EspC, type VII ESX diderm n=1 Tax=Streptomyces fildesensis TaxID=375757 RepID=A0ABW8CHH9_9ACTN
MGEPDLAADTLRIRQCSAALKRVHDEFDKHANPADGYGRAEIGSDLLTDVFHDFGSNWKVHRTKLTEELEKLAKITEQAADTYDQVDSELAQALRGEDKK